MHQHIAVIAIWQKLTGKKRVYSNPIITCEKSNEGLIEKEDAKKHQET